MAKQRITSQQLNISKVVDANSWTVFDFGNFKQYKKRVTFSQSIGGAVALTMSSNNLPTGLSTTSGYFFDYSYAVPGNAYDLSIVAEMGTAATAINFTTRTISGSSIAFSGFIDLTLTQA